jgi:transposase
MYKVDRDLEQEMSDASSSDQQFDTQVGLDVAKAKLDVALRLPNGKWRSKVVSNTAEGFEQLRAWLGGHGVGRAHVCMEATNTYWERVAEYLADHGFKVSVVNPAQIKDYARSVGVRTKTDDVDAKVIGQFCAERCPAAWQPPSKSVRNLRALVSRREALIDLRTQEQCRLETAATDLVRQSIEKVIAHLDEQIAQIERQIKNDVDDDPTLRQQKELLDSIPGFGPATIGSILSRYGGELRFQSSRQAVAYAGLDVKRHESGTSVKGKPRLTKKGLSSLRAALYMPAVTVMSRTDWGKRFAQRLLAAGKPKKLILGALMRKMVAIAYGVLKSGKPFDPALHAAG